MQLSEGNVGLTTLKGNSRVYQFCWRKFAKHQIYLNELVKVKKLKQYKLPKHINELDFLLHLFMGIHSTKTEISDLSEVHAMHLAYLNLILASYYCPLSTTRSNSQV